MKRINRTDLRAGWGACCLLLVALAGVPAAAMEISPGDIVFSASMAGQWDLWVKTPDAADPVALTNSPALERHPAVGPDGGIAFVGTKRRIWIMNPVSGEKERVPLPRGTYGEPAWFPGGRELVFVQYRALPEDAGEVWRMRRTEDGWASPERVSIHPPMRTHPAVSPDGGRVAYATFTRDRLLGVVEEIGVVQLETGDFRDLTQDHADSFWPAWSPDGNAIAYTSNLEGDYDLWMITVPGGKKTRLTRSPDYDGEPSWSPDGREIVFVSNRTGHRELWVASADGKRQWQLTNMKGTCAAPCWVK